MRIEILQKIDWFFCYCLIEIVEKNVSFIIILLFQQDGSSYRPAWKMVRWINGVPHPWSLE